MHMYIIFIILERRTIPTDALIILLTNLPHVIMEPIPDLARSLPVNPKYFKF